MQAGNRDVINRVLKVAQELSPDGSTLLPISAAEVEAAFRHHLDLVLTHVKSKVGNPFVYWGLVK